MAWVVCILMSLMKSQYDVRTMAWAICTLVSLTKTSCKWLKSGTSSSRKIREPIKHPLYVSIKLESEMCKINFIFLRFLKLAHPYNTNTKLPNNLHNKWHTIHNNVTVRTFSGFFAPYSAVDCVSVVLRMSNYQFCKPIS